MQQHAEEQRDYHGDGCKCPDQTPRYPVANEGEEGQKQEEGPVHLHVYTCHSSYLEGTAHTVWPPNREAEHSKGRWRKSFSGSHRRTQVHSKTLSLTRSKRFKRYIIGCPLQPSKVR